MGQAKGTLLVHLRDYVHGVEGAEAWAALLAAMTPEDRAVFEGMLVAAGHYPVGTLNRAVDVLMKQRPNPKLTMQHIAAFTAERDIPTLYKVLMKLTSLESILARADSVWRRYFDAGGVEAKEIAPRHWEMHLSAPTGADEGPGPLVCRVAVTTWWQVAFRIAKVNASIVHDACRFDAGRGACRFTIRW